MTNSKRVLYFLEQVASLMLTPRSHRRSLGTTFDTISSHSHHTSIIAYVIARMEGLSHEDGLKALAMGSLHDLAEARTGDLDFISKNYCKDDEEKAIKDQFNGLSFGKDLEALLKEFEERETKISRCVKDADSVAQIYHEWVLMWQGNKLAQNWFEGDFKDRVPNLHTASAKDIVNSMKESNPNEWWWSEFVNKDGSAKNLNHLLGKNFKK